MTTVSNMTRSKSSSAESRSQVRVLTDWNEFESLRAPWEELDRASGAGLFVSHDWLSAWHRAFGRDVSPRLFQVWRDGQLVAAAPLCLASRRIAHLPMRPALKCLTTMSNSETPFFQFLVAPGHDDALDLLLGAAAGKRAECDMCQLEPIRRDSQLEDLRGAASGLGLPMTWCNTAGSVTVDVTQGWEAYLADCTKSFRKKIRRERRNLEAVEHRWRRGTSASPDVLERAFAVSLKSWKGSSGTSISSTDQVRAFYNELWDVFGPDGSMEINLLEINGKDAGCLIAVRHRDVIYGMKIDFDESFSEYSPGRMMAADFVERSAKAGLREVDMLRRSSFTGEFSKEGYGLGRLRLFPHWNVAALWYSLEERLRPIGRNWRRKKRKERRGRGAHTA